MMQEAAVSDCLSFDPLSLHENCLAASEVDVGGRQVADALVVTKVIAVGDEAIDLTPEAAGQVVISSSLLPSATMSQKSSLPQFTECLMGGDSGHADLVA